MTEASSEEDSRRDACERNIAAYRELHAQGRLEGYRGNIVVIVDGELAGIFFPSVKPAVIGRTYHNDNPRAHIFVAVVDGTPEPPAYFIN